MKREECIENAIALFKEGRFWVKINIWKNSTLMN